MSGTSNPRRRTSSFLQGNSSSAPDEDKVAFQPLSIEETNTITTSHERHPRKRRAASILKRLPESQVLDGIEARVRRNVWRDFLLLLIGCLSLTFISYVETHASEERHLPFHQQQRQNKTTTTMDHGIVDTGFAITTPIHDFLKAHRHSYNDFFAFLNSAILLIPGVYGAYTVFHREYSFIFRILFVELLRSFCGWATYLPPSNQYLMSYYDFPDIIQCVLGQADCSAEYPDEAMNSDQDAEVLPFVSFFSGHVATMVICANHMYLSGFHKLGIAVHILNILQILRLLATRGHYSIDIIIAWFVAVLGSNPAGKLGRYYSRGDSFSDMLLPTTATEAFESLTGVDQVRNEKRVSTLLKHTNMDEMFRAIVQQQEDEEAQAETHGLLPHADGGGEHGVPSASGNKFQD